MKKILLAVWLCCLVAGLAAQETTRPTSAWRAIYTDNFEKQPGAEWSPHKTETAPSKSRAYLGAFHAETVKFILKSLPAHSHVRVRFDLLIAQSWDGEASDEGPDVWRMALGDGRRLINATFSNVGKTDDHPGTEFQSFPDNTPGILHPFRDTATKKDELGQSPDPRDSCYPISVVFPHDGNDLLLEFSSPTNKGDDECWAIDDFTVEVLNVPPAELTADWMDRLWTQLGDGGDSEGPAAVWALAEAGEQVFSRIQRKLPVPQRPDANEVAKLIVSLDANDFHTREKASAALVKMGPSAAELLEKAKKETGSLEVESRLTDILEQLGKDQTGETVRLLRLVHLLEVVGGPKSRDLLNGSAQDAGPQIVRREAKAALDRINKALKGKDSNESRK